MSTSSNNNNRNEFTHELDAAINMYSSSKSVPFFRALLNERQYPLTAADKRKLAPALVKGSRAKWQPTCPVCGRDLTEDGCKRHGIAAHESRDTLGLARPELVNILWKKWLPDRERVIIVASQTITKTVQVTTGIFESEPRKVTHDRFFVTMAESARLSFGTDRELEVANQVYFGRGVPLGDWVKEWSVWEPVEEFHGPIGTADEAMSVAERWAQQVSDDLRDQRSAYDRGDDEDALFAID